MFVHGVVVGDCFLEIDVLECKPFFWSNLSPMIDSSSLPECVFLRSNLHHMIGSWSSAESLSLVNRDLVIGSKGQSRAAVRAHDR